MALDIALLGKNGQPEINLELGAGLHFHLMMIADTGNLQLLSRLRDFYQDVDYEADELQGLVNEIGLALEKTENDSELKQFLESLKGLAILALQKGVGLAAIAD